MAKFPKEALFEYIFDEDDHDELGLRYVESSPWKDEGKYGYQEVIFEHDGKFYAITRSRTGSYYTDYYYAEDDWPDMVECLEVEKVSITTHEWRRVTK